MLQDENDRIGFDFGAKTVVGPPLGRRWGGGIIPAGVEGNN